MNNANKKRGMKGKTTIYTYFDRREEEAGLLAEKVSSLTLLSVLAAETTSFLHPKWWDFSIKEEEDFGASDRDFPLENPA